MLKIAICADDFALSPGISEAIVELVEKRRISATSCMTVSRWWHDHASKLRPLSDRIDTGLHLTLTDGRPLGEMPQLAPSGRFPDQGQLLRACIGGKVSLAEIREEFVRQIDKFVEAYGCLPDYLDGHHHVHQLPWIRDTVIDLFLERFDRNRAYIRCCWDPPWRIMRGRLHMFRAAAIALPGWHMRKRLFSNSIAFNLGFAGVHDFRGRIDFPELMQRFLIGQPNGSLIMCHPGFSDAYLQNVDPVTLWREEEFRGLMSKEMDRIFEEAGVTLCRLSETLNE